MKAVIADYVQCAKIDDTDAVENCQNLEELEKIKKLEQNLNEMADSLKKAGEDTTAYKVQITGIYFKSFVNDFYKFISCKELIKKNDYFW